MEEVRLIDANALHKRIEMNLHEAAYQGTQRRY